MSPSSRRLAGILAALALLAGAFFAVVVVHVPPGSVLLSTSAARAPGWRLAPVWTSREILPLTSRRTLDPVTVALSDDPGVSFRIRLQVSLEPEALRRTAREIGAAGGLDPYLAGRAGQALRRVLQERPQADPLLAAVQDELSRTLTEDLGRDGLTVSEVAVEAVETEALRRLRRRRARAMVEPVERKVMLIGLDGADWQVIDALLERGRMPVLQKLLERGVRADLRSNDPMLSPLLWTTVATGKAPEEHGIMDFLLVEPETGKRVPMSSRFRRVKALWNILTDLGLESQFIGWWATWPAERVSGTMVTDRVSYSLFAGLVLEPGESGAGLTFPPGYITEVRDRLVAPRQITFEEIRRFLRIDMDEFQRGRESLDAPPTSPPEAPVVALARVLAAARTYHALALDLLSRGQPDLLAVYYEGIDQVGHRFQHAMPPRMSQVTDEEYRRYGGAVESYYAYQDELLGELVAAADPESYFIVLSDHGFRNGTDRPRDLPPFVSEKPGFWHRRYGIFVLAGPRVVRRRLDTVSLYDIAPTVLHLLGLPRAEDMSGRILTEAFDASLGETVPAARLATYEGFGDRHQAPARTDAANVVEQEMIRELTALGYVSSDAEAASKDGVPDGEGAGVTANYHLNLASILAGQGKYREAETEVRAALAAAPIPDAFRILSQVLEKQGDRQGAIDAARQALERGARRGDRTVDTGRLRLVGLLLETDRLSEARHEAAVGFEDTALGRTAEGLVAEKEGRAAAAVQLYRAALEEHAPLSAAMERLYRLTAPAEVGSLEPLVLRALEENEQLATFHNVLGVIRKGRGDLVGALRSYRRASELDPDNVDYLANLGAAEMIGGDLDEALAVLERARRKDPDHPDVWLNLGSVHGKAGRPRRSLEAFRRAEELGAQGPGLALGQVLGHVQLGEMETARRILAQARSRYPDDPNLRQLEGELR